MANFSELVLINADGEKMVETSTAAQVGNGTDPQLLGELQIPVLIHVMVGAYITFSVLIALLNILTIVVVLRYAELKTVTNMFVLSLSSADLLLSPTLILVNFLSDTPRCLGFVGARVTASMLLSAMYTSSGASLFSILAIAIDRYFAVLHPYNYRQIMTPRRATLAIAAIWIYCAVFTSTLIGYYIAQTPAAIFVTLSLLSVILPFPVYLGAIVSQIVIVLTTSVCLYVKIFLAIRRRQQTSLALRGRNPQTETVESRRITQTMALVLGALIVSWTPYTVVSIIVTKKSISQHDWLVYVAMAAILLLYSNSFMNPIIYASRCIAFRQAYWHMLCQFCNFITRRNNLKPNDLAMVKASRETITLDQNHQEDSPVTEL